ncbi:MAG TPA: glycosyl hydrolase [Gemmatimonadales bacterium]|nr:glycosyl hydrolase [Gemmatimonadales bacterium]
MRGDIGRVARTSATIAAAVGLLATTAVAQAPKLDPRASSDTGAFAALTWREIGPYRGGRSVAVAGSAARPNEYYMGTTGGGVFKTTDGGLNWHAVSDGYFGGTIGAVAVSESKPDIVYVGTGEFDIRGNVSHGDGVYRTDDGGKTWRYLGLAETRQISRVLVHPKNPDVVYVAALGHVWAPNLERGIYRSTDGGVTWKKILFRNDSTGAIDLAFDPSDPATLYAAFWQAGRMPWKLVSGGAGSGIFKSTDGGTTWKELTRNPGLPRGIIGNIGLAVSPAKPSRVWAIVEADSGGVFVSDDAGDHWRRVNSERKLRQRAWYYTRITADPRDTNTVYVNNVRMQRSTDGGRTFKAVRAPHGDSHALWIAPDDPMRMVEGDDGGATVSRDGGHGWTPQAYATGQFYHVSTTTHFPYRVCGAQQDNTTLCGPSRSEDGIGIGEWYDAGGGESGYVVTRPDEPDIMYAGSYGGYLTRRDARTGLMRDVNPWPRNPMGHSAADIRYRFQWTYPILVSPDDPKTLYAGANVLFRSTDEGEHWDVISPDLTRHDPKTLGPSGGPITKDQTSVEYYGTIFTIAESPKTRGVLWTGSDDGLVYLSRDGGGSWTNVTPTDMAPFTRVSMIEASPHAPGTAFVAANRYQLDDLRAYGWRTDDYGATWRRIDAGLEPPAFVRVVREDPARADLLYAGTERGVMVSFDGGAHWRSLQRNLPPVPVHDLAVKSGDLVAATHGRGFWILDDLSMLRQFTTDSGAAGSGVAHLYRPRDAYRIQWGRAEPGSGANPPSGAVVWYSLSKPREHVTLQFFDSAGALVRRFTSDPDSLTAADSLAFESRVDSLERLGVSRASGEELARREGEEPEEGEGPPTAPRPPRVGNKAGLNRFVWDLRAPDAVGFDSLVFWAGTLRGPVVPPGRYSVRMSVGGAQSTDTFAVLKDPRTSATPADLAEQYALLIKIRDRTSAANEAVRNIRRVRAALEDREHRAPTGSAAGLARVARPFVARLDTIEAALYQVKNRSSQDPLNYPIRLNNEIAALAGVVASTEAKPTAQSYAVFEKLSAELDGWLARFTAELNRGVPAVNAELGRLKLEPIEMPDHPSSELL